jgi:hypothetical protein
MRVYRLLPDYKNFWCFDIDTDHLAEKLNIEPESEDYDDLITFGMNGVSYIDKWSKPQGKFKPLPDWPHANEIPDVILFNGSVLVLSQRACSLMRPGLEEYGEFLPVDVRGRTFYILNVLKRVNIDDEKTKWNMLYGTIESVKQLIFDDQALTKASLFYCDEYPAHGLYCTTPFKQSIEDLSFNGLIFNPITLDVELD